MRTWRYWARLALVAVVGSCYVGATQQAVHTLGHRTHWDWPGTAAASGAWVIGMTAAIAVSRSGFFGPPKGRQAGNGWSAARRAVESGELPLDAEPDALAAALCNYLSGVRQSRWVVSVWALAIAAMVAAAAHWANADDPAVWALAVGLAVFAIVPLAWLTGRIHRAERLLAELDASRR